MRLVVSYQPDNYMALYHAGMSEYILGQMDFARTHLRKFLDLYHEPDGYRNNARRGAAAPRREAVTGRDRAGLSRARHAAPGALRDRARDRPRRLLGRLPRPRPRARRRGRAQAARPAARRRPRGARADAARGPGGPRALPRQHRRRLRFPRGRPVELHRHGVRPRARPAGAGGASAAGSTRMRPCGSVAMWPARSRPPTGAASSTAT